MTYDRPDPEICWAEFWNFFWKLRKNSLFSEVVGRVPNEYMVGYLQTKVMKKQKLWLGKESKPLREKRMEQSGSHTKTQVANETWRKFSSWCVLLLIYVDLYYKPLL